MPADFIWYLIADDERKKLLVDFNQKMSEKYYWFMPADGKMIDDFLKNKI